METKTNTNNSLNNLNSTIITRHPNLSPNPQRHKPQLPTEHLPIHLQQLQEATHSEVAVA